MYIYHFDIADLIPKFADILTLMLVILTYLTVKEVKKQRETLYIPDLFVAQRYVDFYPFDFADKMSFFEFDKLNNQSAQKDEDEKAIHLNLKLHNIGYGSAKYIEYTWDFDPKKIYALVESTIDKNQYTMEFDTTDNNASITHNSSQHFDCEFWDMHTKWEIDVVVPDKNDKASIITVPSYYTTFLIHYLMAKNKEKKDEFTMYIYETLEEFPKLKLTMKYLDIMNKSYSKTFDVKFTASGNYSRTKTITNTIRPIGTLTVKVKEERELI